MLRTTLRRMPLVLKVALSLLLLAGILGKAYALVISWNADDLRGVWVMTCPMATSNLGEYYIQFSMGGAATNGNTTLGVLGGGTYQESPTRSVTGGSFTVTSAGAISGSMTLQNPNALLSTFTVTAGTMQQDKNTVTGITATDSIHAGLGAANMTKISDQEVRDGNNAGQACFLSASRR